MAIILRIDYAKKLGLPNFSSHQCSASLQVEISDPSQVARESRRLYGLLQAAVDHDLQQVGFLPDVTSYGMNTHGNGSGNGANAHREADHWTELEVHAPLTVHGEAPSAPVYVNRDYLLQAIYLGLWEVGIQDSLCAPCAYANRPRSGAGVRCGDVAGG